MSRTDEIVAVDVLERTLRQYYPDQLEPDVAAAEVIRIGARIIGDEGFRAKGPRIRMRLQVTRACALIGSLAGAIQADGLFLETVWYLVVFYWLLLIVGEREW